MSLPLQYYISRFNNLNCNKRNGEVAPHKAVLLLAVIDEMLLGHITNGFVPHNDLMVTAFLRIWRKYVGISPAFNPVFETPFFHLAYEPFWTLMKREPFKPMCEYSLSRLRENFFGAKLPDDLCEYIMDAASCNLLKKILIEKYFPDYYHRHIQNFAADSSINYESGNPHTINAILRA